MNFQRDLADLVMAGEKTVTRRATSPNPRSPWYEGGCSLKVGRDYAVCPGRGKDQIGRVEVTAVDLQTLGEVFGPWGEVQLPLIPGVADLEARREGFPGMPSGVPPYAQFQLAWHAINGGYDGDTRVWRVEFRLKVPADA